MRPIRLAAAAATAWAAAWAGASTSGPVQPAFYKDVLPIFQENCQECHRTGEIAPFPLTTYSSSRPWAKAIKAAVLAHKMPPWFADPHYGSFSNDRSLSKEQIATLVAWVDAGAPAGDEKDAPAPRRFTEGWNIARPDAVIAMTQPFRVPATGEVDYQYIVLPTGFTGDKWVQAAEMRPSARGVVHHIVVFVRPPESTWLRGEAQPGVPYVPPRKNPDGSLRSDINGNNLANEMLTIYTPGMVPDIWPAGVAKKIPAGSDLVFQIHYTTNGKAVGDQGKIGLVFAKEPPARRALTLPAANLGFRIPPGEANYRVDAKMMFPNGAEVLSFFPHMHLRGRAFQYVAVYPDGHSETLLKVDPYDFHWQLSYKERHPVELPPGTRFECTAWFDNSVNNPNNPDPAAEVRWGEQTREEMMVGFFDVEIPADMTVRGFFTRPKKAAE